jgi:hypothetical protein
MAPPAPCTNRPATSSPSEPLAAQPTEPNEEHRDRGDEGRARAEAVGHPAAYRDEDREREEVRRQRELERDRIGGEIERNGG